MHALGKKQVTNEADSEVCTVLAKSSTLGSASSSSIVAASFSTAVTKAKKPTAAEHKKLAKTNTAKADILKLFVGRSKA